MSELKAGKKRDLEKIDIVNTRYYYSNNVFEGIISIISKKGDLMLYEFPEIVFRQEHEFLSEYRKPIYPDYSSDSLKKSRLPDTRNTLFWEPALKTTKNGSASLEFFTGDEPGEYDLTIEGFSVDGIYGISRKTLIIKPSIH
jgi:hypothetical protein